MAELLIHEKEARWVYLRDLRPRNTTRQPANNVRPDMAEPGSISGAIVSGATANAATGAASKTKVKSHLEFIFMC
jgi:fermentation-respiration switch protein FrsA (DUF1100 family)